MRTFEFNDGKSNKFWNIELEGEAFTVTYGKIGTAGQTQTKEFATEEQAQAAHDKLVKEKLAKGYVETTTGASAAPSTGKALENAILANPDDLGAHAALADWLIEQGDPRGEFIQFQLALEDPKKPAAERKKLQQREKDLLKKHERAWLGDLAPQLLDQEISDWQRQRGNVPSFRFARGWLDSVYFVGLNVAGGRALAKAPQARLLSRLAIESAAFEEAGEYEAGDDVPEGAFGPAVYPLLQTNGFTNVRVFQLGEMADEEYNCHMDGSLAAQLIKKMPRIEELYLLAHAVDLEALFRMQTLQNLRVLQVYHVTGNHPLEVLAKNPALGNLTSLLIHPHALEPGDEGAYINLKGVKALVHSPHLQSLTHLRLRLNDMGDKGCQEIVKSGILKRLKVLDLQSGCITDKGALALAASPDLKNLEALELSNNCLTEAGIAALKGAKIKLRADKQRAPVEEGEMDDEDLEYLYEGDIE